MMEKKLRFALFGNTYQAKKSASVSRILAYLYARGAEISIERGFFNFLKKGGGVRIEPARLFDGSDFSADFVISMGGDGTLLKAAMHVGGKQIPIIGVNMGRLGFLASVTPDGIERTLDAIYDGDYSVEQRSAIRVGSEGSPLGGCPFALNDIAVLKRDNASMITIHVSIDGEYVVTYRADGLVVSTPTGSTAYSLSNGGPIIVPGTGVLCLTPVAPHSLNIRPIVIPDTARVALSVESRSHNFLVAIDGRSEKCSDMTRLEISKAEYIIKTVRGDNVNYITTLREKMMWGADNRG